MSVSILISKNSDVRFMSIKIYIFILVLFLVSMSACTIGRASPEKREEVFFDDGSKSKNSNERLITNADLNRQASQISTAKKNLPGQTVIASDKSKITTMIDSYGNKTETRCFVNHPRLECIVVQTSPDGKKQTVVYGAGQGAKILPENLAGQALTASADELASSAGITETRSSLAGKPVSPYGGKDNNKSLQPMPSYKFPIPIPKNQQFQTPETQQNTETTTENSSDKKEKDDNSPADSEPEENI